MTTCVIKKPSHFCTYIPFDVPTHLHNNPSLGKITHGLEEEQLTTSSLHLRPLLTCWHHLPIYPPLPTNEQRSPKIDPALTFSSLPTSDPMHHQTQTHPSIYLTNRPPRQPGLRSQAVMRFDQTLPFPSTRDNPHHVTTTQFITAYLGQR